MWLFNNFFIGHQTLPLMKVRRLINGSMSTLFQDHSTTNHLAYILFMTGLWHYRLLALSTGFQGVKDLTLSIPIWRTLNPVQITEDPPEETPQIYEAAAITATAAATGIERKVVGVPNQECRSRQQGILEHF
jgi:hypothetical protein